MTADDLMLLIGQYALMCDELRGPDLHAQIKAEVTRLHAEADSLRVQLAHWRLFGEHAEAERSRLQLEVQKLREELAVEKKWGELWYFVSDEAPLQFEKIVSEWTPSRWIDQAHKLMAERRA